MVYNIFDKIASELRNLFANRRKAVQKKIKIVCFNVLKII